MTEESPVYKIFKAYYNDELNYEFSRFHFGFKRNDESINNLINNNVLEIVDNYKVVVKKDMSDEYDYLKTNNIKFRD